MVLNLCKILKIRIYQNDRIIRAYHSPHEVIVRPQAKKVEIFDTTDSLIESYDLLEKDLSWLEDEKTDSAEIVLDLKVGKRIQ